MQASTRDARALLIESREKTFRWGWLVIALAVLLAYWPLSSFHYTLTHGDTLNCWLPWRWFISSSLMDGQFPMWDPHQQFGYPIHSDLQGPAWYVEAIALGGTIGHSIYTLQSLFLLYLMIGGWGMLRLVRSLHGDARIGTIIGVAYALGGFFTGHQMHFYSIISAAWLPWLMDAFIRLLRDANWRTAARVALLLGLLLTGGNHTFAIIGSYLLGALFVVRCMRIVRENGWERVLPLLKWSTAAAVGAAIIAAGVLHAWWETGPYLSRAGGLTYRAASEGALTGPSLISLFFPFATGTDAGSIGTGPTMANAYMGALVLPFALLAFVRKRSWIENVLLVLGIIMGFASFGNGTPVHEWMWSVLPGLDLFRFPAYFSWFVWFAMLVLAAGSLDAHWNGELDRGGLTATVLLFAVIAVVLCVNTLTFRVADGAGFNLFERMQTMALAQRVLWCAAVSIPVLLTGALLAWKRKLTFPVLLVLVLVEMGWNTSLAQWNTGVSDIRPRWLHDRLSTLSQGPVLTELRPTLTYDDNGGRLHYLMHNTQDFIGGFSRNGVNTFWLKNAMALEIEHQELWNAMSRQPVAYLADSIVGASDYVGKKINAERDSGLVVLEEETKALASSLADQVEISAFDHNSFTLNTRTEGTALLVLQQSHYPGWQVMVDGEQRPLLHANVAAMAVEVPNGEHNVVFRYVKPIVPVLLACSMLCFFGLLIAISYTVAGPFAKIGSVALALMVLWSLFAHDHQTIRRERAMNALIDLLPDHTSVIMNDDGSTEIPAMGDMAWWSLRADDTRAVGHAEDILVAARTHRTSKQLPGTSPEVHWIDAALKTHPAVRAMILDHWDVVSAQQIGGCSDLMITPRSTPMPGRVLHLDSVQHTVDAFNPFGSGTKLKLNDLEAERHGSIVVDLVATSSAGAEAVIVFERKRGDRSTDYRTIPISVEGGGRPHACYALLSLEEVWRPDEEMVVYLWSHRGHSLKEAVMRIRATPRTFYSW